MQVVKAALEAYADRYRALGIRPTLAEADALVISIVQHENPTPKPSRNQIQQMARDFISKIDNAIAKQPS